MVQRLKILSCSEISQELTPQKNILIFPFFPLALLVMTTFVLERIFQSVFRLIINVLFAQEKMNLCPNNVFKIS